MPLVVDRDDPRVVEACRRARLAAEARDEVGALREVRVHDLERDRPVETAVQGPVDGGHAAACDARVHLVPAVDETAEQRVAHGALHAAESRAAGRADPAGVPVRRPAARRLRTAA